jgi:small subunit ribosomal protein S7
MLTPDPKYNNLIVEKFVNQTMRQGKKTLAQNIVYSALEIVQEKTKKNPLEVFSQALKNAAPRMETKPKRVGGATYQVPMEVKGDRQRTLAIRWILEAARSKKGKPMSEKLAEELILASKNEGAAIRKKINVERMAEANKAFAHLAR